VKRIVVTGGSGTMGQAVVRDLAEHGRDVLNVDLVTSSETVAPFLPSVLTDLRQTLEALRGADAVMHAAAIPAPDRATPGVVFQRRLLSGGHGAVALSPGHRHGAPDERPRRASPSAVWNSVDRPR
jgi:nucleoside-diphosphate-sugar epimerase